MDLSEVQLNLGYWFRNEDLLVEALTHSSCLNEPKMGLEKSNEALAWLGDAVVYWVYSEALYDPKLSKDTLTEERKEFINECFQAGEARRLGLDRALKMPEGQERQGGRDNLSNLHTVYEAVVGAVYLDQGIDEVKKFLLGKL